MKVLADYCLLRFPSWVTENILLCPSVVERVLIPPLLVRTLTPL